MARGGFRIYPLCYAKWRKSLMPKATNYGYAQSFGVEWCNSVILRDTRAGELLYHHIVMIGINAFVESFLWELLGCA